MSETSKKSSGSVWGRYGCIWLSLVLGMSLGLSLSGRSNLVLNVFSPFLLTLGCGSLIGLSAICIWGLPILIPLGCVCHAWLQGRDRWWRLLPVMVLLVGLLTALGLPLASLDLPMLREGTFFEAPPVPTEEEITAAYTVTMVAWSIGLRACGILLLLLLLHLMVVCGWRRSWQGVVGCWHSALAYSRSLHQASEASDQAAAATRGAGESADSASSQVAAP